MTHRWIVRQFKALSPEDLYDLLRLRVDVFVVEQACPYGELDGKDKLAQTRHIWSRDDKGRVFACARVLPPGASYPGVSIGRVAVAQEARGRGVARALVSTAIAEAAALWPKTPVQIGAQAYLADFYHSCGFTAVSDPYLEDNIPHIDMVLNRS